MNSAKDVEQLIAQWKTGGTSKEALMIRVGESELGWPYCWGATGQLCTPANRKAKMANSRITDGDRELIRKRCQVLSGSKGSCSGCAFYPQDQRTRMYDCIGFINQLLDIAGIDHYGAGCTTMWKTARQWKAKGKLSTMPEAVCLVFQQKPGYENEMQHIGLYIGNGWVIHCSKEVKRQKLKDYPWTHFGILVGMEGDVPVPGRKTVRRGSTGDDVVYVQTRLIELNYNVGPAGADGKFGAQTEAAVKEFQRANGLTADGIVGPKTYQALADASADMYTVTIKHVCRNIADELVKKYGGDMSKEVGG